MKEIIIQFSHIIETYDIITDSLRDNTYSFEAYVKFINRSKLSSKQHFIFLDTNEIKYKYAFQWMQEDNALIIRWDNAPHHQEISSFPHHKHISSQANIQESFAITLQEVLEYIEKQLQ